MMFEYLRRRQDAILRALLWLCATLLLGCVMLAAFLLLVPEPAEDSITVVVAGDVGAYEQTIENEEAEVILTTATELIEALEQSVGMTQQERDEIQLTIDEKADAFLQTIDPDASEYEKVKAVYEHVVQTLSYNSEMTGSGIDVAFLYDEAVCEGYSRMAQYLLNRLDVCAVYVTGSIIKEESAAILEDGEEVAVSYHAWNMVRIEGEYYYIDTTWGEGSQDRVDYKYLCLSGEDLVAFREVTPEYRLPEVTGTAYNYYLVEGLYLEEYTYSAFQALLQSQPATGYYTMQFSSTEELTRAISAQMSDGAIYDTLRSIGVSATAIQYNKNEDFNVLNIYVS